MELLIWIGAAVTLIGIGAILWSILQVAKAKRAGLDDEALRGQLQRMVTINLGAFLLSALGLIMVVAGIFLS
ncbi:hypothetical protein [Pseudothioclava nitratireducens]|jgi:hypothetical protein|uniref:hypothetical protein n=1 Tax=Pseudothioclava nitratireducens TaxID=1928646 RepID=UPI0023DB9D92|nr:hypothetical protein [Defluviimonas nitratireducens]MDF1619471.1 hypothetical protein [Defluviimonas nitratireducens]